MSHPSTHPRRTCTKPSASPPSLFINTLRKSDTFNARTGLRSSLYNYRDNASFRPRRSPTTLDESFVVDRAQLEATRQEIVDNYLKNVDDALQSDSSESSLQFLNDQHILAVPHAVADQIILSEQMDVDEKKHNSEHHHCSDSGLGSSIDTPQQGTQSSWKSNAMDKSANTIKDTKTLASALSSATSATTVHSAITKSFSADSVSSHPSGSQLSAEGLKHIQETILEPLLSNLSLKEFHPLIAAVPAQIQTKIINNLRDLEKTFLYGAPIKRYAAIMRQTRERQERGEPLDEMDYSPDEHITIEGGLSNNGRPAELVRKRNGKSISLMPEEGRSDNTMSAFKRPFMDDEDSEDDDVLRSMARRRKSDKAGDVMHVCSDCKKEFKRPCDLTKHEKTHSRPFKCSEPSCRYHDLGWPTEKERDRHVNDKHSSAPKMYSCNFTPCSYSSKRESNCKQHMEKAHGWTYVRSKSNGRKRAGTETGSVSLTPPTPMTSLDVTPGYTPESHFAQSPWWSVDNGPQLGESSRSAMRMYGNTTRRDSVTTANTNPTYSSGFSPDVFCNNNAQEDVDFKSPVSFTPINMGFQSPIFPMANGFDFNSTQMNYAQNFNISTPVLVTNNTAFNGLPNVTMAPPQITPLQQPSQFSPTGQADVTLYSPDQDEGYGGGEGLLEDFVLFPSDGSGAASNHVSNWTVDTNMNNFGGQFEGFYDQSMFPQ